MVRLNTTLNIQMKNENRKMNNNINHIQVLINTTNREKKPSAYIKPTTSDTNWQRRQLRYQFENGNRSVTQIEGVLTEVMEEEKRLRSQASVIMEKAEFIRLLVPPYSRTFSFGISPTAMAFDIDNHGKPWTTKKMVDDVLMEYDVDAFCYDTFSYGQTSSKEMIKPKFRVIIFFDKPIEDVQLYKDLYIRLAQLLHANPDYHSMEMYFYGGLKWENEAEIDGCTHLKNIVPKTCNLDKLLGKVGISSD